MVKGFVKSVPTMVSLILLVVFLLSVFQKLTNYPSFNDTLIGTDFFYIGAVSYFSKAVIALEFINCYYLLYKQRIGLFISASLLSIYLVYVILLKLYYFYPSCGCGGIIAQLTFEKHVLINTVLLTLTVLSLTIRKSKK